MNPREEFERDFRINNSDPYYYNGTWYSCERIHRPTKNQRYDCTTRNRILHGYRIAYKSAEGKIKKLTQDCQNFLDINNNQSKILKSREEEIKQLWDVLECIKEESSQHSYAKMALDRINFTVRKVLRRDK